MERVLSFALKNRLLIVLLTALVAAFGLYSLRNLPIDAVPDITNNQVQINTVAGALSPGEIEKQVTYPIETALAGIPGLESTRSLSRNGFSQVTAIFSDATDIYFARQQVGERLVEAKESLPAGAEPAMGAISTGLGEIYMWAVEYSPDAANHPYRTPEGEVLSTEETRAAYLRTVQDWMIRPQLKTVAGVAGVDAIGGYVSQYQVEPDAQKLLSYGLSFADLTTALAQNNASIGAGYIEKNGEAYIVRADGRVANLAEIGQVVVANRNGVPIYVKDVANLRMGAALRSGSASKDGREVVIGTALMRIGENSRTVAEAVDAKLAQINKTLPPGIIAKTVLNRMTLVDATIATVERNLAEGALLVIAVLFLLLGNLRAALIAALVIPLSMLITATGMVHFKISGNLMSLGALDFGLIVDGAVIITENALRRLAARQHHEGRLLDLRERLDEVMQAAKEMIQPSVFGQAIIILVYVPLLSFSGVEGKMFEPMALTVILALVAAFILSLTFVPAMIALCVRGKVEEHESRLIHAVRLRYAPLLQHVLNYPRGMILGAVAAFVAAMLLFLTLGQEFIPSLDEKDIAMHAMRIPSTSLSQSQAMQLQVEKAVSTQPEVAFAFSKTGTAEMAGDPMPPNVSDTFIVLKDRAEWADRALSKPALIARIEEAVNKVPGNNYEFTQPIQMRFNELISGVRSDVAVKIYGDDFDALEKSANAIAKILRATNGAADVKIEQVSGLPVLEVQLNREQIARYGLNVSDVQEVIAIAIGGRDAGLVFQGDRRFSIVVRLSDAQRQDVNAIGNLPIALPKDARNPGAPSFIPLKQVANLVISDGPNQISRENGKRRMVVQANVRGRDIGSFVEEAAGKAAQAKIPAGYWLEWGGQFENLQAAKSRLALVVPTCFVMIFLLLFSALGSTMQAAIVFSGVPLALTGGVLALWLRGMPFSISAAVGMIALSGIAVLNGLVLITSMNQRLAAGETLQNAVYEGAMQRLRPVLMTALVASLGFVPMAIASGAGAEVQKPLATVVIGGLITSTILTLLVLPAMYRRLVRKGA